MNNLILHLYRNSRSTRRCLNYRSLKLYSTKIAAVPIEPKEDESIVTSRFMKQSQMRPKARAKKPQKPPFVKNLFLAVFDVDLLAYRELEKDESEYIDKNIEEVKEIFKLQEKRSSNIFTKDLLEKLNEMQLISSKSPLVMGGRELDVTGTCRFQELISESRFKEMILNNEQYGINTLLKNASDVLKAKYLSSLVTGKMLTAFCLHEANASWTKSMNTTATLSKDKNAWIINGEKAWVINGGTADLFIVFAQTEKSNIEFGESNLTAFLVERSFGGVTSTKCDTFNNVTDISHVKFNNTPVPEENIIGKINLGQDVLGTLLPEARLTAGIMCTTLTKDLCNRFINYCIHTNNEMVPLAEVDLARDAIADMVVNLYAMESMVYFTSKLMDDYENQDCELETAIVKTFSSERCHNLSSLCVDFIGTPCIESNHWSNEILREALNIKLMNENNDGLKLLIALHGLKHAGAQINELIRKLRNPAFHPWVTLKRLWTQRRQGIDDPKLTLDLPQYLHPSLILQAQALEYCVFRLHYATEIMLTKHGSEVVNKHVELKRLADSVIDIYAMTACLARASRSYCIGLQNADFEMFVATTFCLKARERVKNLILQIENAPYVTSDEHHRKIAKRAVKFKEYFFVHPLSRNY